MIATDGPQVWSAFEQVDPALQRHDHSFIAAFITEAITYVQNVKISSHNGELRRVYSIASYIQTGKLFNTRLLQRSQGFCP
jgi:hypothetical protein